jgi:hypothetical protein
MPTFDVVPTRTRVELGQDHTGRAAFQVRNTSTRGLLAQTLLRPGPATPAEWLTVEGDVTRSYSAGAVVEVDVDVRAPAAAPPGSYPFHVEVIGLDNPDEDLGRSPDVSFLVPRVGFGYVATFAGAVAGGAIGIVVGLLPVVLALLVALAQPTPPASDLGTAIGQIIGRFVLLLLIAALFGLVGVLGGLWLGPVVGSAIALRLRNYEGAATTAGLLAVMQPVWSAVMVFVLVLLFRVIRGSGAQLAVLLALAVLALVVPPWPARWLTLRLRGRRQR